MTKPDAAALFLFTLAFTSAACGASVATTTDDSTSPPPEDLISATVTAPSSPEATSPSRVPSHAPIAAYAPVDEPAPARTPSSPAPAPSSSAPAPAPAPAPSSPPPAPAPAPLSAEHLLTTKLGLSNNFLIGLGNDATGGDATQMQAYALPHKVDLHYVYLAGLDWPDWTAPTGSYVLNHANAAKAHGIVPMFTLYQAAAYGENNMAAFDTVEFMTKYWRGVRVMFQELGTFASPAVVHVEPDFWGYAQNHAALPSGTPVLVSSLVPECTGLPSDVSGMAKCIIHLSRQLAPKVAIGLSASSFGAYTGGYSDPAKIGAYLKALGADQADLMVVETLDRDAGCFEVGTDPNCQRAGTFYWDETNVTHPNFHDHLAWAKIIHTAVGRPLLWWQTPLGVPSSSAGSTSHYRDNRVHYLFSHAAEFVAAGGIGAVFGTGAVHQTDASTDASEFTTALGNYVTAPAALP